MSDVVNISVTDVPEYVSIYISAVSSHTHGIYLNSSLYSLFEQTSHTSAITSVAMHTSLASLFQYTSNNSNLTLNALHTSASSLFRHISADSQLQFTSNNSILQHVSNTSDITSLAFPLSDASMFAGTGTSATNASITLDSIGLAISIADPASVDHSHGDLYLTNLTGTSASSGLSLSAIDEGYVAFVNSNGISFGTSIDGVSTSVYGSVNTDYVGTGVTGYNASATLNSAGMVISVATGGSGGADGGNILAAGGSTAASTGFVNFADSNGISFGLSNGIITAKHDISTINAAEVDHSHGALALTNLTGTSASNGLTLIGPEVGAATNAVGLNTAATNVVWTVNTSGISLDAGKYLTTAALSNHAHGNVYTSTKSGANLSIISASSGLSIGVPNYLTTAAASNHTHSQYINTSISNNIFYTSASSLLQHTSATSAITSRAMNTSVSSRFPQSWRLYGNTTGVSSSQQGSVLNISGGNNITLSGTNNTIRIDGPIGGFMYFSNIIGFSWGTSSAGNNSTIYLITG